MFYRIDHLTDPGTVLQRVQNAAARLICACSSGPRDHVTPSLRELHWLLVEHRIIFKLCTLMLFVHKGRGTSYTYVI